MHESTIVLSTRPPELPTLVQYDYTLIGQYATLFPTSGLYAIHHTILIFTISCKDATWPLHDIVINNIGSYILQHGEVEGKQ